MIIYIVTREHAGTMGNFLRLWGKGLADRIKLLPYAGLQNFRGINISAYIFSDIERLSPANTKFAAEAWEKISISDSGIHLLNHPVRSLRRYGLLRTLYERGINAFNIYRLNEGRMPDRFPVFLRGENDHLGSLSPLLDTPESLDAAIEKIGPRRDDKVIVEFCDTSDGTGMFRKYSAYRIGDRIIPQHMMFDKQWMVKGPINLADEDFEISEERAYVEDNPHEAQLREIFELAGIEYGRIDYGILNGRPQVWEINTNPTVTGNHPSAPKRRQVRIKFIEQITAAFEEINSRFETEVHRPVLIDESLF